MKRAPRIAWWTQEQVKARIAALEQQLAAARREIEALQQARDVALRLTAWSGAQRTGRP
jgi:hypothetical protein